MIDNHLYIPNRRLHKEKCKRKGSEYRVYPYKKVMHIMIFIIIYQRLGKGDNLTENRKFCHSGY